MIRKLLFLALMCSSLGTAAFQADTSAYQTQRLKVNALLSERSAKFGQYDKSLDTRTGIFGFQTKEDIRNSNEILRQIVLNDNNIFKELKILMDYKDQEVKQVQRDAGATNTRIQNYMILIKKLQDQNQQLKAEYTALEKKRDFTMYLIVAIVLAFLGIGYFSFKKLRKV